MTKFLVYNARKRQKGGDRAESYFRRTECVAGVLRWDMRFQELMPDVFHWLGIRHIDRWVSMSNMKRDALLAQGIYRSASRSRSPRGWCRRTRRSRWRRSGRLAISRRRVRWSAGELCAAPVAAASKRERPGLPPCSAPPRCASAALSSTTPPRAPRPATSASCRSGSTRSPSGSPRSRGSAIPPSTCRSTAGGAIFPPAAWNARRWSHRKPTRSKRHGRGSTWRSSRSCSTPAPGAGWRYCERETGLALARSEGLGVASLRAMQAGLFSSEAANPWRADAAGLQGVTAEALATAICFRRRTRPTAWTGLEGRAALLRRLGAVIAAAPEVFGTPARLGHLVDYWHPRRHALPAPEMLGLILRALGPIWPGRLCLDGVPLGDCGRHGAVPGDRLVLLHKLSQWLTYLAGRAAGRGRVSRAIGIDGFDRARRVPQRRPVRRRRACWKPRDSALALVASARSVFRGGRRVARADGRSCSTGWRRWSARGSAKPPPSFRCRACSKAAPGRRGVNSRPSGAPAAHRPSTSSAMAPCFEQRRRGRCPQQLDPEDPTIVDHPLVQHKLSLMRDVATSTAKFRRLMHEISVLVAYEATRHLPLERIEIETPLERAMRAGAVGQEIRAWCRSCAPATAFSKGMLELLPAARVGHIGPCTATRRRWRRSSII